MNSSVYSRFATVYDQMDADRHSVKMVSYTSDIIGKFSLEVSDALDLCCGTGSALKLFSQLGWRLAGLDQSRPMLKVAKKKLRGCSVDLYEQSLPKFAIRESSNSRSLRRFSLITCFYDSLNYLLTAGKLKGAFKSVYRHLKPGGLFVFDMNTPEALKVAWDGGVYADQRGDLAWIWKSSYNEQTGHGVVHATFFEKSGRHWKRFEETHTEAAYSRVDIRKWLGEAGFVVKAIYQCYTFEKPTSETMRICVIAQRKS
ncbi:MAG: class I SAM-dependent methyltransferase [candidate division Zixibacteria bacterium]